MGWGGLGWAELEWGGEGGSNYTSRKVSGKFSLDVLFMEYFSPESVFAVDLVSGKLIGTSPPTIYSSGLFKWLSGPGGKTPWSCGYFLQDLQLS